MVLIIMSCVQFLLYFIFFEHKLSSSSSCPLPVIPSTPAYLTCGYHTMSVTVQAMWIYVLCFYLCVRVCGIVKGLILLALPGTGPHEPSLSSDDQKPLRTRGNGCPPVVGVDRLNCPNPLGMGFALPQPRVGLHGSKRSISMRKCGKFLNHTQRAHTHV